LYIFNVVLAAVYIVNDVVEILKLQRGKKRLKREAVERLIVNNKNFHSIEFAVRISACEG